jgi:hypothetical protein
MPIQLPVIDDRRYQDLIDEVLARIPAHTPEWSQPRVGDPGVTLVELFAWLADTVLYRANLIPERQRLAFLSLVGRQLRPAVSSRGIVALSTESAAAIEVKRGSTLDGPPAFQTEDTLTVLPVQGRCFVKRRLSTSEQASSATLLSQLQDLYELSELPQGYVTHEVFAPVPGGGEPVPVDIAAQTVDGCLWIALVAAKPDQVETARAVLGTAEGGARRRLNIGLALAPQVEGLDPSVGQQVKVPHVWELSTGALDDASNARFLELEPEEDSTAVLSGSGVLRLALPSTGQIGVPENDPRRVLKAGVGGNPPRVDDPALAARLVGWLRLRLTSSPALQHFAIQWAGIHAVRIVQRQSLNPRLIGTGDGGSAQSFSLGVGNVDAASLVLELENPQSRVFEAWQQVSDLADSGPDARVFELDAEAGVVRFGDGLHGAVPAAASRVRATTLQAGGGVVGNLPAQTLQRMSLPGVGPLKVQQALPTLGGADAETLEQAERRIPAALRHRDRAVTANDYRDLLKVLPRGDVGRVEVLPRFKPQEREPDVPGVVSVMVWPQATTADYRAPAPRADRLLLEAAHAWLEPRRPLGTELYVIGTEYVGIGVSVAVRIRDGHAAEEVLPAVRLALRKFLWALPDGGIDGQGWPLGRLVDNRELEVVVARVPGVDATSDVSLFVQTSNDPAQPRWQSMAQDAQDRASIPLLRYQLPELLAVSVIVGDIPSSSPQGAGSDDLNLPGSGSGAGRGAAAVPLVPEVC